MNQILRRLMISSAIYILITIDLNARGKKIRLRQLLSIIVIFIVSKIIDCNILIDNLSMRITNFLIWLNYVARRYTYATHYQTVSIFTLHSIFTLKILTDTLIQFWSCIIIILVRLKHAYSHNCFFF